MILQYFLISAFFPMFFAASQQNSQCILFDQVASGTDFSVGLSTRGELFSWGYNNKNQLGILGIPHSRIPVAVNLSTALISLGKIRRISAGNSHVMCLVGDGYIISWGDNSNGQLGIGHISSVPFPVKVNSSG